MVSSKKIKANILLRKYSITHAIHTLKLYDAFLYPPAEDIVRDHVHLPTELYPYQREGVKFLYDRKNALLADDMGLGKTVQALIALEGLFCSERAQRALVICPKAVLENWRAEALRWVNRQALPMTMGGSARKGHWKYRQGLLLATPQTVWRDEEILSECWFDVVVADDVSLLKNETSTALAIRKLRREVTWCLNGSPLENSPEDLVNVTDFAVPGLFSNLERHFAPSRAELQQRISPYFLRRLKIDCLPDLPPKRYMAPFLIDLTGAQKKAYHETEMKIWEEIGAEKKLVKFHFFTKIQKLIFLCDLDPVSQQSAKLEVLEDELERILETKGGKCLIFTQWLEPLEFLMNRLHRFSPVAYHGDLTDAQRAAVLQQFQYGNSPLLISTKAGGRGLNLQQASYVYHFDQTWNPHDAWQAEARAWRMGQQRGVDVYRFLVRNTIEERIDKVLESKRNLFYQYVETMGTAPDEDFENNISMEELMAILQPSRLAKQQKQEE